MGASKIRGSFAGVPIIRVILCWVSILGKLPHVRADEQKKAQQVVAFREVKTKSLEERTC